jgi:hypothetical protein
LISVTLKFTRPFLILRLYEEEGIIQPLYTIKDPLKWKTEAMQWMKKIGPIVYLLATQE